MNERLVPCLLSCGPLVLTLAAWAKLYLSRPRPRTIALVALGVVTANATLAAVEFARFELRPHRFIPGWEDPQVLSIAMLMLFAPIGMFLGLLSAGRGTPKWLTLIVEIASIPLVIMGFFAVMAV